MMLRHLHDIRGPGCAMILWGHYENLAHFSSHEMEVLISSLPTSSAWLTSLVPSGIEQM